ncbi:serine acetyltransferase [Peribacillus simplex]|uniref:serine O-acetyltransferase n=1 Tax=Peribacillus simplex TaxID=1478 RepID=UPI002E20F7C1|nr:serine acetyltransferase [Peribacillus simplex]
MRIARVLWVLKSLCNTTKNSLLRRIIVQIYNTLVDLKGSYIGHTAKFENIPIFPHGVNSVFISGASVVGKDCVIFQQVTIGSNSTVDSQRKGSPQIGDNCYIGAGAKIIGNVVIGNNVRIGANCVVFQDVPDNSVVVLPKPRVIVKDISLDNKFYQYKDGLLGYVTDGSWQELNDSEVEHDFKKAQ